MIKQGPPKSTLKHPRWAPEEDPKSSPETFWITNKFGIKAVQGPKERPKNIPRDPARSIQKTNNDKSQNTTTVWQTGTAQEDPKHPQGIPIVPKRCRQENQEMPQAPQEVPRATPEHPKRTQEHPKRSQEHSQSVPRDPKRNPQSIPRAPKDCARAHQEVQQALQEISKGALKHPG